MDDVKQVFGQEAEELLLEMEDALLALEDDPSDKELINSLFRAMHTIKGAAGIFNFIHVVEFTHPIETEVDRLRTGEISVTTDLIATLLKCKDHTAALVEQALDGEENLSAELKAQGEAILLEFNFKDATSSTEPTASNDSEEDISSDDFGFESFTEKYSNQDASSQSASRNMAKSNASSSAIERLSDGPDSLSGIENDCWVISLDFKEDALRNGLDPLSFIRYLSKLGEITEILTISKDVPPLDGGDFEGCYLKYRLVFKTESERK
jgi:two-component system chemotaxis sensor kinase CheA